MKISKQWICFFVIGFSSSVVAAQSEEKIVYAKGTIVSSITDEPIESHIYYESVPFGSITGSLYGDHYEFPMLNNTAYSIVVKGSARYASAKYVLEPHDINENNELIKNIRLKILTTISQIIYEPYLEGKVIALKHLSFERGKAIIRDNSLPELDSLVQVMKKKSAMIIQLEGYSDAQGSMKQSFMLSKKRVGAVRKYLMDQRIPGRKIKTKAFVSKASDPQQHTVTSHLENRRVDVRILKSGT